MREVHWKLLQSITAVVIFLFVGTHLVHIHLWGGEPTTWASVSERAASIGWVAFYIIILAVGLYHGIFGLRVIVSELSMPLPAIRILNWVLFIVGVCVFAYAAYIALGDILTMGAA